MPLIFQGALPWLKVWMISLHIDLTGCHDPTREEEGDQWESPLLVFASFHLSVKMAQVAGESGDYLLPSPAAEQWWELTLATWGPHVLDYRVNSQFTSSVGSVTVSKTIHNEANFTIIDINEN